MLYHAYEIRRAALGLYQRGLWLQADVLRAAPSLLVDAYPVRATLAAADVRRPPISPELVREPLDQQEHQ